MTLMLAVAADVASLTEQPRFHFSICESCGFHETFDLKHREDIAGIPERVLSRLRAEGRLDSEDNLVAVHAGDNSP